jgi:hypothetical protein
MVDTRETHQRPRLHLADQLALGIQVRLSGKCDKSATSFSRQTDCGTGAHTTGRQAPRPTFEPAPGSNGIRLSSVAAT